MAANKCYGCPNRKAGCHSGCADYLEFIANRKKITEERAKESALDEEERLRKFRNARATWQQRKG